MHFGGGHYPECKGSLVSDDRLYLTFGSVLLKLLMPDELKISTGRSQHH